MRVRATQQGYDNVKVREIDEVFEMPDDSFDKRPVLNVETGQPTGKFYPLPSWFVKVGKNEKPAPADGAELV